MFICNEFFFLSLFGLFFLLFFLFSFPFLGCCCFSGAGKSDFFFSISVRLFLLCVCRDGRISFYKWNGPSRARCSRLVNVRTQVVSSSESYSSNRLEEGRAIEAVPPQEEAGEGRRTPRGGQSEGGRGGDGSGEGGRRGGAVGRRWLSDFTGSFFPYSLSLSLSHLLSLLLPPSPPPSLSP